MALYVYGLMRGDEGARAAEAAGSLRTVEHGGLCALVASASEGETSLQRKRALSYSNTLQEAYAHGPVLPVRFGTVLPDAAAVQRDLLAPNLERFLRRLDWLEGYAEMQVKVAYQEEPLLSSILHRSPQLMQAAARIRELPAAATHFEQISLGEAIAGQVQLRRQADSEQIVAELGELSVDTVSLDPAGDHGAVNAAFLVAVDRLEEFDAAVERLSDERRDAMQFKLIGPMPAYSFADRPWETEPAANGSPQWA